MSRRLGRCLTRLGDPQLSTGVHRLGGDRVLLDSIRDLVETLAMTDERVFNVDEAKLHFSRLLAMVQAGEHVVIVEAGRPLARVVPISEQQPRRPDVEAPGLWVAEDFDAALPGDLLDAFEGRS